MRVAVDQLNEAVLGVMRAPHEGNASGAAMPIDPCADVHTEERDILFVGGGMDGVAALGPRRAAGPMTWAILRACYGNSVSRRVTSPKARSENRTIRFLIRGSPPPLSNELSR